MKTKIYCAPMEGLTTYPFRQVHHSFFPGIEKYFTPFLVANQTLHFKKKEIRELLPENNAGLHVVPQVLTNKAEEFLWAVRTIQGYGYEEINLNLGCPSPTVVTRGRGAGFLADQDRLDRFFDAVFEEMGKDSAQYHAKISIKTRTGLESHAESAGLMRIFNRYPICELIIHPRRRVDFYKGRADLDVFAQMMEESIHPVCCNGDINTPEDYQRIKERFPDLPSMMIGRGLIRDPALAVKIRAAEGEIETSPEYSLNNSASKNAEMQMQTSTGCSLNDTVCQNAGMQPQASAIFEMPAAEKRLLQGYLRELCRRYADYIDGEHDVVAKMKEVWSYVGERFPDRQKGLKQIRKAKTYARYEEGVRMVLGASEPE